MGKILTDDEFDALPDDAPSTNRVLSDAEFDALPDAPAPSRIPTATNPSTVAAMTASRPAAAPVDRPGTSWSDKAKALAVGAVEGLPALAKNVGFAAEAVGRQMPGSPSFNPMTTFVPPEARIDLAKNAYRQNADEYAAAREQAATTAPGSYAAGRVGSGIPTSLAVNPLVQGGLNAAGTLADGGTLSDAAKSAGLSVLLGKLAQGTPGAAGVGQSLASKLPVGGSTASSIGKYLSTASPRTAGAIGVGMSGAAAANSDAPAGDRLAALIDGLMAARGIQQGRKGAGYDEIAGKVASKRYGSLASPGAEDDVVATTLDRNLRQAKTDHATAKREQKRLEDIAAATHQKEMLRLKAEHEQQMAEHAKVAAAAKDTAARVKAEADRIALVESYAAKAEAANERELARLAKLAEGEGLSPEDALAKAQSTLAAQMGETGTRTEKQIRAAEAGVTNPTPEQLAEIGADYKYAQDSLLRRTPESVASVRKAREIGYDERVKQIAAELTAKAAKGDPEAAAELARMRAETPDFKAEAETKIAADAAADRADRLRRLRAAAKAEGLDLSGVSDEQILGGRLVDVPEPPAAPSDDRYKSDMLDLRLSRLSAPQFDAQEEALNRTTPEAIEEAVLQGGANVGTTLRDREVKGDVTDQYLRELDPSPLKRMAKAIVGSVPGGAIGGVPGAAAGSAVSSAIAAPKQSLLHSQYLGRSLSRAGLSPAEPSIERYSRPNEAAAIFRDVESGLRSRSAAATQKGSNASRAALMDLLNNEGFKEWVRSKADEKKEAPAPVSTAPSLSGTGLPGGALVNPRIGMEVEKVLTDPETRAKLEEALKRYKIGMGASTPVIP